MLRFARAADGTRKRPRRNPWFKSRRTELEYGRKLQMIAAEVGRITSVSDGKNTDSIIDTLKRYAELIGPWARTVAWGMLQDVDRQDQRAWAKHAENMSRALRREIQGAPTGAMLREALDYNVGLIKSLPLDAAKRVHRLTLEGIADATRASEIQVEILKSGDVTASRAMLIARTEAARTSSLLTEARARHIGSPGYFWRTAHDSDVRPDHKKLEGVFVLWNDPPIADERSGTRAHAGCIWNCRCYAEPQIGDIR